MQFSCCIACIQRDHAWALYLTPSAKKAAASVMQQVFDAANTAIQRCSRRGGKSLPDDQGHIIYYKYNTYNYTDTDRPQPAHKGQQAAGRQQRELWQTYADGPSLTPARPRARQRAYRATRPPLPAPPCVLPLRLPTHCRRGAAPPAAQPSGPVRCARCPAPARATRVDPELAHELDVFERFEALLGEFLGVFLC